MTDSEVLKHPALDDAPSIIAELAVSAAGYIERAVGLAVDFSPETLPLVDHYVSQIREDVRDRPELLALVGRTLGAYFGQVAVRHLNGFWQIPSEDDHRWLVCLRHVVLAFNPVGVVHDVLLLGEGNGPSPEVYLARNERDLVHARLESLPQVGEDEYFMLSTRLEGFEIAAVALADLAQEAMELEWEDYQGVVVP